MPGYILRPDLLSPVTGALQRRPLPPLHAVGTTSRPCAPSDGPSQCSPRTLAPTSGWATRFSRCRWVCQAALHLVHLYDTQRHALCCWQAGLAVACRAESCSLILALQDCDRFPYEGLCIAARGVCLASARCRATCSSPLRQLEERLRTGPAVHACGTTCVPEVAPLPCSASRRRGRRSCGRWTWPASPRMQLCCPRCTSTWASRWRLRGCSSQPASTTGGLPSLPAQGACLVVDAASAEQALPCLGGCPQHSSPVGWPAGQVGRPAAATAKQSCSCPRCSPADTHGGCHFAQKVL